MAEDVFEIAGSTQGAFTVEKVVAEGGFGVVYRAYHDAFRAPVALKCLKMPAAMSSSQQEEFIERFREEAEVLFRLSSTITTVVRPLHVDVLRTKTGAVVPFIALEWLEGETLAARIASRLAAKLPPFKVTQATRLLTPVARALDAAHHFPGPNGPICVVHRDIKPANIFLALINGQQVVKILDFGIARVRGAASMAAGVSALTGGPIAFTPGYASPEQWLPKRFGATGPWTDVWGLALTLVELLIGHPPLDGDVAAIMGTAIDEKRRPTPRSEGVAVPDAVESVLCRALAVDPRDRHKDAGQLWDELEQALGFEPSRSPAVRPSAGPSGPPDAGHVLRPAEVQPVGAGDLAHDATAPAEAGTEFDLPEAPVTPAPPPTPVPDLVLPSLRNRTPRGLPQPERRAPPPLPPKGKRQSKPRSPMPRPPSPRKPPPVPHPPSGTADEPLDGPPSDADPVPISVNWGSGPRGSQPTPVNKPQKGHDRVIDPSWQAKLRAPIGLAAGGAALAVLDRAAGAVVGERMALGPVRLFWLAAAMVLLGVFVGLWRMFWPSDD